MDMWISFVDKWKTDDPLFAHTICFLDNGDGKRLEFAKIDFQGGIFHAGKRCNAKASNHGNDRYSC